MLDTVDGIREESPENPLLQIDTNFRHYLNAYTRSFQNHIVNGTLDYAFDSDFTVRQKISGLVGFNKLAKSIVTQDITSEAKLLFRKFNQAGPLKFPEVYDVAKLCAERLELKLPIVFVRDDVDEPLIYSIASDIIEPCIIVSYALVKFCTKDELQLLIGCECGKLQNNHCQYNFAITYINYNKNVYKPVERSHKGMISNQIVYALPEWMKCADITADRAGMICCDNPEDFPALLYGIYQKGFLDFFGRKNPECNYDRAIQYVENHQSTSVRDLKLDSSYTPMDRRLIAACQFLNCESLYSWRRDLKPAHSHPLNREICDARTNMIAGISDTERKP